MSITEVVDDAQHFIMTFRREVEQSDRGQGSVNYLPKVIYANFDNELINVLSKIPGGYTSILLTVPRIIEVTGVKDGIIIGDKLDPTSREYNNLLKWIDEGYRLRKVGLNIVVEDIDSEKPPQRNILFEPEKGRPAAAKLSREEVLDYFGSK